MSRPRKGIEAHPAGDENSTKKSEENSTEKTEEYLRFADLKRMGIVRNHQTLGRWVKERGFPRGRKLHPGKGGTRIWPKTEIREWFERQPHGGGDANG